MSCSRSSGMSNSDRSRWKLSEQTMIRVLINFVQHTQCSNMTSMTQRQERLIKAKPGHRIHLALEKLKITFSSSPWHRRTIHKDWESKCRVATKQHRDILNVMLHQPQTTNSFRDKLDDTTYMVLEGEPILSNCTPRMSRLELAQMETPDKIKSPWGGFTVLYLLTTKAFCFVRIQQVCCWLANNWH